MHAVRRRDKDRELHSFHDEVSQINISSERGTAHTTLNDVGAQTRFLLCFIVLLLCFIVLLFGVEKQNKQT